MAIVDDRGRVFGKVNLVDAALIALFLGLIPLAYGAYALFRTPAPRLTSVTPASIQYRANMQVKIEGENLRPYMRVSFNDVQGRTFLFASSESAVVDLGDLPPGVYDVVLYDYAQERARLPKALTITAPPLPSTSVIAVGMFANLSEDLAKKVVPGLDLNDYGKVLAVGRPVRDVTRVLVGNGTIEIPVANVYRVPTMFKLPCAVQTSNGQPVCIGAGVQLMPDVFLLLKTPLGVLPFQISQIRSTMPLEPVDAVVRLVGRPEALALVKAGDVDLGTSMNELAAGARVVGTSGPRPTASPDGQAAEDVTLRLEAQQGLGGWEYGGGPLRAGGAFLFRTLGYELRGSVLRITPPPAGASNR